MEQQNILLIEDSDDDEQLILRAFKKMNLVNNIVIKRDGEEALAYFFDEQGKLILSKEDFPQLILLDLQLPRISGLDVLQRLRAHDATKSLPVSIFTSSDAEIDIAKAYSNGANSFVQKPIEMHNFFKAVQELGSYWLLLNKKPSPYGPSCGENHEQN